MEGIYVGKIKRSRVDEDSADLFFVDHCQDIQYFGNVIDYDKTAYCLVPSDDIIINNDEILKLRDEVKRLTDECNEWKVRYSTVNNKLFQKDLAYGTLETAYKNEKIAGEMLLKDRDALKEQVEKLDGELTKINTALTLREAYIKDSIVTNFTKTLSANGIEFKLKEINGEGNWDVTIDIPKLNEAEAKVSELEKKLAAAKSNETFWRDRKEEKENCLYYWLHTYDRVVKQAADKGIHIGVCGNDEECNAGLVVVDNVKASELLADKFELEEINQKLRKRISAADERIKDLEKQVGQMGNANKKLIKRWSAMTEALKEKGVEALYEGEEDGKPNIDIKIPGWEADKEWVTKFSKQCADLRGDKFRLYRERDELKAELNDLKKEHSRILGEFALCRKQAECDHKKLEELKSKKVATCTMEAGADGRLKFIYTYANGHTEAANIDGSPIDTESISCGTIPKCSSCAHYMHNPSRYTHDWCYKPVHNKEGGAGYIRKLNKEEAEGPACSDFKKKE